MLGVDRPYLEATGRDYGIFVFQTMNMNLFHGLLKGLQVAAVVMMVGVSSAAEIRQIKVVSGIKVSFSVIPVERSDFEDPSGHGGVPRWKGSHRIVIELSDGKTGQPIVDADVLANIAERGFAGEEKRLEPTKLAGKLSYATYVDFPERRAMYRILVHIRKPGSARTSEAEFEYRHHH